jgi:hypothetical protein
MSDPFICYDLIDIGRRARFDSGDFSKVIDHLARGLVSLVDKARKENASSQLVDSMMLIYNMLLRVKEDTAAKLEQLAKYIDDLLKSGVCNLEKRDVCTSDELAKLVAEIGFRRAAVECLKKNIVACRDITNLFADVEEGERIVEVIYYDPIYDIKRTSVRYKKGWEKIRGGFHPLVPAVYEKCLGINVEFAHEGKEGEK